MANYNYYRPGASLSGCPGTAMQGGWYAEGSSTPITTTYINPSTGKPYSPTELGGLSGGGATPTTPTGGGTAPTTTPTGQSVPTTATLPIHTDNTGISNIYFEGKPLGPTPEGFSDMSQTEQEAYVQENFGVDVSGQMWAFAPYMSPGEIATAQGGVAPTTTTTTFGGGAGAGIPTPTVTPAPAYEISPEMQEAMDLYGDKVTDWVESGGYGLSPEVQAQMIQQQSDTLKAREQENIRVMTNNMERRGITNSGFLQSAENQIHSNTTVALAGAIADVQIKSALLKMESFEKGMGQMGQYLGFLSEQSQLAYVPEFATWKVEQEAKLQNWQAQMDVYKMELNQAYQTHNIVLQGQIQGQLNTQQHQFDIELAEMEIEANQKAAKAKGAGSLLGIIIGGIFSLISPTG